MDSYESESGRIFSAFFEIYKIYIPLHRSDLKISAKNASQFWWFWKIIHSEFRKILFEHAIFQPYFDEILSEFHEPVQKSQKSSIF